jgi:hypothetical protein
MRFRKYLEVVGEEARYVPPYFRKSGTKRGNRSHLVPCIGFAAHAVDRLDRLSDFEGSKGRLFPAAKRTKSDRGHAEAGLFNDYFSSMPGSTSLPTPFGTRSPLTENAISVSDPGKRPSFWITSKASNPTT